MKLFKKKTKEITQITKKEYLMFEADIIWLKSLIERKTELVSTDLSDLKTLRNLMYVEKKVKEYEELISLVRSVLYRDICDSRKNYSDYFNYNVDDMSWIVIKEYEEK